jgi:hypothetical protein
VSAQIILVLFFLQLLQFSFYRKQKDKDAGEDDGENGHYYINLEVALEQIACARFALGKRRKGKENGE